MAAAQQSRRTKPWDVPPPPVRGDADKEVLFAAVGKALSSWETLEGRLALIFGHLVSPKGDDLPALRAYGALLTSHGRCELLLGAAEGAFFLSPNEQLHQALKGLILDV
jgi:hypothetical protein